MPSSIHFVGECESTGALVPHARERESEGVGKGSSPHDKRTKRTRDVFSKVVHVLGQTGGAYDMSRMSEDNVVKPGV
eukprot:3777986-Pleurochrysis_carterae.AAC.1